MEKLDEALVELRQNMRDHKKQSAFYDLFLNATFFVPVLDTPRPQEPGDPNDNGTRAVLPMVIEAEGNDYLMLFSSLERLKGWSPEVVPHIEVPGHVLALNTVPPLHWALNAGTDFSKQFHPEEIAWLRACVERCNEEAAKGNTETGCCG
ncbi:MAG TPA: SseB family protein [Geomonas sp.]|nr:SseB family protein [Geomonas sp.]